MTSQRDGHLPKVNEDTEPKFRHVVSNDIVNTGPPFCVGSDIQEFEVKDDQLSTANLTSKPEIAGKIPDPNHGDKSGVGRQATIKIAALMKRLHQGVFA